LGLANKSDITNRLSANSPVNSTNTLNAEPETREHKRRLSKVDPDTLTKVKGGKSAAADAEQYTWPMKFKVHIHQARNLLAKDDNGLSDPYVIVELEEKATKKSEAQRFMTSTVKENLNPVWDEEITM
jgi:Ca2+-dependent lipid-binding protein